jgi:hypothetical protein
MPANECRLELELILVDERTRPAQMHVAVAFRQLSILWQHSCQGPAYAGQQHMAIVSAIALGAFACRGGMELPPILTLSEA